MSLNLTELKDEPLGLAPTSADFCVPGTCFVELKDEPLGKHPIQAAICGTCYTMCYISDVETEQVISAHDDVRSFTFDVDGVADEALDFPQTSTAQACISCVYCWVNTDMHKLT